MMIESELGMFREHIGLAEAAHKKYLWACNRWRDMEAGDIRQIALLGLWKGVVALRTKVVGDDFVLGLWLYSHCFYEIKKEIEFRYTEKRRQEGLNSSLDAPIKHDDKGTLKDVVQFNDPEFGVIRVRRHIDRTLSGREAEIAARILLFGDMQTEVADDYGLSRERIRQIMGKCTDKMVKRYHRNASAVKQLGLSNGDALL